jgi:SH3-like domain-containing protein
MLRFSRFAFGWAILVLTLPVQAQAPEVPYWAAIKAEEVNMRVGPGEDYRIMWVYRRPDLPLKILRKKEGWRLVRDPDGAQGWMLAQFLKRERTGYVHGKQAIEMHSEPSAKSRLLWRLAPGVVGKLGECAQGWCPMEVGAHKGFVEQAKLWGAGEP